MQMKPVESSNIAAVGYDPATRALRVAFKSGTTHDYADVAPEKHKAMMEADSVGKYFHANIRNVHASKKLEEQPKQG